MGRHNVFLTILAEFGRALAAARRYENLRCRSARHDGLTSADIPPRIFEEFYARCNDTALAPTACCDTAQAADRTRA